MLTYFLNEPFIMMLSRFVGHNSTIDKEEKILSVSILSGAFRMNPVDIGAQRGKLGRGAMLLYEAFASMVSRESWRPFLSDDLKCRIEPTLRAETIVGASKIQKINDLPSFLTSEHFFRIERSRQDKFKGRWNWFIGHGGRLIERHNYNYIINGSGFNY